MESITCKNCGTVHKGKYCPECGQKASVKRITISAVLHDTLGAFVAVDRGVMPTMRDLLVRPGQMLRSYIDGRRAKYINPGRFLLSVVAVSYLVFFVVFPDSWAAAFTLGTNLSEEQMNNKFIEVMSDVMAKNYTLMSISLIPFLGFWMWVFFRKSSYNLAEHLTAMTFINAMISLLPLPFMLLARAGLFSGSIFLLINFLILFVYTQIAVISFVRPKSKIWAFIKISIAIPIGNFFWILTLFLFISIWALQTGKMTPEDFLNQPAEAADSTGVLDSVNIPLDSLTMPADSVQPSEFR